MATLPNMFSMLTVSAVLQSRVCPTGTFSTELQFWGTEVRTHAVAGKGGSSRSDVDMVACLRLARRLFRSRLYHLGENGYRFDGCSFFQLIKSVIIFCTCSFLPEMFFALV